VIEFSSHSYYSHYFNQLIIISDYLNLNYGDVSEPIDYYCCLHSYREYVLRLLTGVVGVQWT